MKKTILSVAIFAAIGFTSCNSQQKEKASKTSEKTEQLAINNVTFGVRGNCGMCKSTIEKAANSLAGVSTAVWDVDQKKIAVSFDASKTLKWIFIMLLQLQDMIQKRLKEVKLRMLIYLVVANMTIQWK